MNVQTATFSSQILSDIFSLLKPRITLLAIITTAAGLFIAPGTLSYKTVVATLLGSFFLVSGAGALNMFLERESDALMDRTKGRPLPDQRLAPEFGLGLGCLMIGISIPVLIYFVNLLTAILGIFSLGIYVLIYTPLKRITALALLVGAIPGAAPPLMGWTAATDSISAPGLVLFGIIFLWQIPHFLAIGTFRREEYQKAGLKLFPLNQSWTQIKAITAVFVILLVPMSLALYYLGYAHEIYFATAWGLNIIFLLAVFVGIHKKDIQKWGKRVFLVSLIYLTVLFGVLFWDGGL